VQDHERDARLAWLSFAGMAQTVDALRTAIIEGRRGHVSTHSEKIMEGKAFLGRSWQLE